MTEGTPGVGSRAKERQQSQGSVHLVRVSGRNEEDKAEAQELLDMAIFIYALPISSDFTEVSMAQICSLDHIANANRRRATPSISTPRAAFHWALTDLLYEAGRDVSWIS